MCIFSQPDMPESPAPVAQSRLPDGGVAGASAQQRTEDRLRSRAQTVLTSPLGLSSPVKTGSSTILGSAATATA